MSYKSRLNNRLNKRKRKSGKINTRRRKMRAKFKTASARKRANKRRYTRKYLLLMNYIKLRDQYQCAICSERNVRLEIHHIRKYSTHQLLRSNKLNLISVCRQCHNEILKNREKQFQSMLSRKAKYNTKRYKLNPLTYEQLVEIHSADKLLPPDFKPFEYKDADNLKIKKAKEFFLRKIWRGIKNRCYNKNNKSYSRYGGRGIKMHQQWYDNYDNFYDWIMENLGERPKDYSLDRINNDGNYEPGNVRWASAEEQGQNRSTTILDQHMVETMFILFHKYKFSQTKLMNVMGLNNSTVVRNVVRGFSFKNITIKYLKLVKHKDTIKRLKEYEDSN